MNNKIIHNFAIFYVDDDRIIYDPDHELCSEPEDQLDSTKLPTYSPDIQPNSHLHPVVVKVADLPNVKFVTQTIDGFRIYNELDSLSGGNGDGNDKGNEQQPRSSSS